MQSSWGHLKNNQKKKNHNLTLLRKLVLNKKYLFYCKIKESMRMASHKLNLIKMFCDCFIELIAFLRFLNEYKKQVD